MMGDKSCRRYRPISSRRIMCHTKDGTKTGYRDAMTDQQFQMYMHNQEMANRTSSAVISSGGSNQQKSRPAYCSQGQVGPFGMPGC